MCQTREIRWNVERPVLPVGIHLGPRKAVGIFEVVDIEPVFAQCSHDIGLELIAPRTGNVDLHLISLNLTGAVALMYFVPSSRNQRVATTVSLSLTMPVTRRWHL